MPPRLSLLLTSSRVGVSIQARVGVAFRHVSVRTRAGACERVRPCATVHCERCELTHASSCGRERLCIFIFSSLLPARSQHGSCQTRKPPHPRTGPLVVLLTCNKLRRRAPIRCPRMHDSPNRRAVSILRLSSGRRRSPTTSTWRPRRSPRAPSTAARSSSSQPTLRRARASERESRVARTASIPPRRCLRSRRSAAQTKTLPCCYACDSAAASRRVDIARAHGHTEIAAAHTAQPQDQYRTHPFSGFLGSRFSSSAA
eukprot:3858722-Pleurochrysis_carterae.AAC.1